MTRTVRDLTVSVTPATEMEYAWARVLVRTFESERM